MLSVVVPTRDRRDAVVRLVRALVEQDAEEVVVVVDGGVDGTPSALAALGHPAVRVVEQPHAGQAAARNRGVAEARGDHLVLLDDDMVPEPGFLAAIEAALADADVALGSLACGDWVPDTLLRREFEGWLRPDAVPPPDRPIAFDEVLFCVTGIRRRVLEAVGGFDASFTAAGGYGNEDVELGLRLRAAGAAFARVPAARAQTEPNLDPRAVLHRSRLVGRSDVALARRHPGLVPALFGEKLRTGRFDRLLAPVLTRVPAAALLLVPLREIVSAGIRRRWLRQPGKTWSLLRKAAYWRGVGEAGGGDLLGGDAATARAPERS